MKGSFPIRTNNIPRSRLDEMGSLISGFKINSRQVLNIPEQPTQTECADLNGKAHQQNSHAGSERTENQPDPHPKGKDPGESHQNTKALAGSFICF